MSLPAFGLVDTKAGDGRPVASFIEIDVPKEGGYASINFKRVVSGDRGALPSVFEGGVFSIVDDDTIPREIVEGVRKIPIPSHDTAVA